MQRPSIQSSCLQVTFHLRLEAAEELQHPLLRTLRISRLSLRHTAAEPAGGTAEEEAGGEGQEDVEAAIQTWQQREQQLAADVTARLSVLLADAAVRGRLSADLRGLACLPAATAVDRPQLLEGFQRLACVHLMGSGSMEEAEARVQPSFFPASTQLIAVQRYGNLRGLGWLPTRRLSVVEVDAIVVDLVSPQPQLAIDQLRLSGLLVLQASVEALACLDCQQVTLMASGCCPVLGSADSADQLDHLMHPGMLAMQPHTAGPEDWTNRAAGLQAALRPLPSNALQERLAPWALALHPLFSQQPRLQSVRLLGMELQLAFPAEAVGPELGHPGGVAYWQPATLRPSATAPGTEAADVTLGGLSLSLRVGSKPGTLQLTAQRSAEGLRELAA